MYCLATLSFPWKSYNGEVVKKDYVYTFHQVLNDLFALHRNTLIDKTKLECSIGSCP